MRSISFLGLHRIIKALTGYPSGIKIKDMDNAIIEREIYLTRYGSAPSTTTLYHCRNILFHLNIIIKKEGSIHLNRNDKNVQKLIDSEIMSTEKLSESARNAFASLVIANPDCRDQFFNLFANNTKYNLAKFGKTGRYVKWHRIEKQNLKNKIVLINVENNIRRYLTSASEINAVLYGLRYWARDWLYIIDEFYSLKDGNVMYPLLQHGLDGDGKDIFKDISLMLKNTEWTTISIQDLLYSICLSKRRRVKDLFSTITWMANKFPKYMLLIPTSSDFATFTTHHIQSERMQLRSYFRDESGKYISHLRLHRSILEFI